MPDPALRMHAFVMDCAEFEGQAAFWTAALGYVEWFAPFGQFVGIRPPLDDGRLPIIFQRVPEAKAGKNRVHMDYETADMAAEVARLTGLGARDGPRSLLESGSWLAPDPCLCPFQD